MGRTKDSNTKNNASSKNNSVISISDHMQKNSVQKADDLHFGSVIKKYRTDNKISQIDLASMMNTSRNTIVNWENDKSRPDVETIRELCMLLGIPLYELFNIPNNTTHTPRENVLLKGYRSLSSLSRKMIDRMITTMLQEETDARDEYLRNSYRILPLEATAVAAGTGCAFNDIPAKPVFIKKNSISEKADAIVRVSGASMEPLYHDNDYLFVIYTQDHKDGDDVICTTADGAVVKRAVGNRLISLNDKYPFGEKYEDDHVQVLGKVIGIVGKDDMAAENDIGDLEDLHSVELREFYKEHQ